MNIFEDKAFATASFRSILGHYGVLAFDAKELPKSDKIIRINSLGFTLTNEYNPLLPFDNGDLYIGRKWLADGELAVNDFVLYSITDHDKGEYIYITSDMIKQHEAMFGKYYAFVNNHKNYHGMWFRATIETYKSNHPDWAINTDNTFNDLKPVFDAHYSLAKNLGINRFNVEMSRLEEFYCWAGFLDTDSKTRYN